MSDFPWAEFCVGLMIGALAIVPALFVGRRR